MLLVPCSKPMFTEMQTKKMEPKMSHQPFAKEAGTQKPSSHARMVVLFICPSADPFTLDI